MSETRNRISIAELAARQRSSRPSLDGRPRTDVVAPRELDARRLRRGTGATVQVNVRLPEVVKADIYRLADGMDCTVAEVIVQAVELLKVSRSGG